jgi:hypothetical protein
MANRVRCVNKDDRQNPYERITHIGGQNADGGRWRRTQQQAIQDIETGTYAYYVERPAGDRVNVIVAKSRFGNKYIKTTADGDEPNNLLSLPECP